MTFIDTYDGRTYTLRDLKQEWMQFRSEDADNHCDSFRTELFEILMATINGRNDLDVVGMTGREISNYIIKMRRNLK